MLKLFLSKESNLCLILIIIQQAIVALSTVFIAELAKSIAEGEISWLYFYLFIASLTFVYIPATLSRIYLEKVIYLAQYKYINLFVNAYRGKIHLGSKEEGIKLPYITSEGQTTISLVSFFFYDTISIVLNIVASLIALSFIIHSVLLISYIVSFCLLSGFIYFTHGKIRRTAQIAQNSRTQSLSQLLKSWRDITINNKYNFNIWKTSFEKLFHKARDQNVHNQSVKQAVSSCGMFLAILPLLGTLTYLLYRFAYDFAFQALLVATLPRQIQMIQNMDIMIQYTAEWADLKQRLLGLKGALEIPLQNPEHRIQWEKIQFHTSSMPVSILSFDELQTLIHAPKRITIRGENGSGKSTLLKCLKEKFGGYYLPANPNLSFSNIHWQNLSTGEQILTALQEVCTGENVERLVLLDEWDANLDKNNREKLSQVIDQLSTQVTIIEVVHRQQ